jgi:hypothetical protein
MPTPDRIPVGAPAWVDLMSSDTDRARSFYGELFGWKADEPDEEFGGYANFSLDGHMVAGLMATQDPSMPDVWSVYLAVEDAEATVRDVETRGLPVMVPAMPVGDLGTMAVVGDPTGAVVGMWQPGTHTGMEVLAESGAPSWFELHTRDHDGAVAFYQQVFGWDTHAASDTPEFRYTTMGQEPDAHAGIMDAAGHLPEGVPSFWTVYFQVEDAEATIARATELGGAVHHGPDASPYGLLAVLSDPMGARFSIQQP